MPRAAATGVTALLAGPPGRPIYLIHGNLPRPVPGPGPRALAPRRPGPPGGLRARPPPAQQRRYLVELGAAGALPVVRRGDRPRQRQGGLGRIGVWLPLQLLAGGGRRSSPAPRPRPRRRRQRQTFAASALYNIPVGASSFVLLKARRRQHEVRRRLPAGADAASTICGSSGALLARGRRSGSASAPTVMVRGEGLLNRNKSNSESISNFGMNLGLSLMLGSKPIDDSDGDGDPQQPRPLRQHARRARRWTAAAARPTTTTTASRTASTAARRRRPAPTVDVERLHPGLRRRQHRRRPRPLPRHARPACWSIRRAARGTATATRSPTASTAAPTRPRAPRWTRSAAPATRTATACSTGSTAARGARSARGCRRTAAPRARHRAARQPSGAGQPRPRRWPRPGAGHPAGRRRQQPQAQRPQPPRPASNPGGRARRATRPRAARAPPAAITAGVIPGVGLRSGHRPARAGGSYVALDSIVTILLANPRASGSRSRAHTDNAGTAGGEPAPDQPPGGGGPELPGDQGRALPAGGSARLRGDRPAHRRHHAAGPRRQPASRDPTRCKRAPDLQL